MEISKENQDRALVLLKATLDILNKSEQSSHVINVMELTANWDDTECDGYCLKGDIECLLEEIEFTK